MLNIGLVIGAVGAVVIAIGAGRFLRDPSSETGADQRWWTLWGAVFIAVGFIAQLVGRMGN